MRRFATLLIAAGIAMAQVPGIPPIVLPVPTESKPTVTYDFSWLPLWVQNAVAPLPLPVSQKYQIAVYLWLEWLTSSK